MNPTLTTSVRGFEFTVEIDENGDFSTTLDGEAFKSERLGSLKSQLDDAIKAKRAKVEFVDHLGNHGFIRGYHAGNREVLVTVNGQKTSLSASTGVWLPEEITEEEIAELKAIHSEIERLHARKLELYSKHVPVGDMLNDYLGANLTGSYTFKRILAEREREEAAV